MSSPIFISFTLISFLMYKLFIYPACISPLAKIPSAHFSSPFSPLWMLLIRKRNFENRTLFSLHERLGPIVRLGPSEISVSCVDGGLRTIYSGGFEKHDFYPRLATNYGIRNMFSTTGGKPHSIRKRMISNLYSKSHLLSSSALHQISRTLIFTRLLPIISKAAAANTHLDVLELNFASAMDFITAYLFGLANGSNLLEDIGSRKSFLHFFHCRKSYTFWPQELPMTTKFLHRLGLRIVPAFVDAANRGIEDWCLNMCKAADANSSTEVSTSNTPPIVYSQLRTSLQRASEKTSIEETATQLEKVLASEALDHLAAGHETAGITLTYVMHEMCLHPSIQARLRTELLALSPPISLPPTQSDDAALPNLPSPKDIDSLPLLQAVLLETLRLHAAIPGPQPRITPSPSCTLAGYGDIPAGTRVSALAYTLHRNEEIFPDSGLWLPERWLDADEGRRAEMGRWFWAFGSGGRMCVGSNFAMLEMKLIITAIYTNFVTSVADDRGIEQMDGYTAGPAGNKLDLYFERVEKRS